MLRGKCNGAKAYHRSHGDAYQGTRLVGERRVVVEAVPRGAVEATGVRMLA